ncbi:MAG: hypothetical protein AAF694_31360 [Bacteroidota bacterium]
MPIGSSSDEMFLSIDAAFLTTRVLEFSGIEKETLVSVDEAWESCEAKGVGTI